MIQSFEPNTIDCAEHHAHSIPFGVPKKCLGPVQEAVKHHLRFMILVLPEEHRLLGAQTIVIQLS